MREEVRFSKVVEQRRNAGADAINKRSSHSRGQEISSVRVRDRRGLVGARILSSDERLTKTAGHHLPVRADGARNELPGSEGCGLGGSYSSMQPPPRKVSAARSKILSQFLSSFIFPLTPPLYAGIHLSLLYPFAF